MREISKMAKSVIAFTLLMLVSSAMGFDGFLARSIPPFSFLSPLTSTSASANRIPVIRRITGLTRFVPQLATTRQVESSMDKIEDLRKEIKLLSQRRCNSKDGTGIVVDNFCYTLEMGSLTLKEAQAECFYKGGQLAEPNFTDGSFLKRLDTASDDDVKTLANSGILIGAKSVKDDSMDGVRDFSLQYVSNGVSVSMVFGEVTEGQVGVIKPMGETWIIEPLIENPPGAMFFLCQYPAI